MSDPDDLSEALDDDRLEEEYPPDQPVGVDQRGITAREEQTDEPIEQRMSRQRPDRPLDEDAGEVGRLVSPDEGAAIDTEDQAVARSTRRAAGAQQPEGTPQVNEDRTLHETALERGDDLSAEEAAVRETDA